MTEKLISRICGLATICIVTFLITMSSMKSKQYNIYLQSDIETSSYDVKAKKYTIYCE